VWRRSDRCLDRPRPRAAALTDRHPDSELHSLTLPFNIVLVVVDALRRDSLGTFNANYRFTPELDRRFATWYRFKHCYTSAPWTLPAITSILSGVSASRHGRFFHREDELDVTRLLPPGYRKVCVVNNPNLQAGPQGFDKGFDEFHYWKPRDWHAPFASARQALDSGSEGAPLFLFLHSNLPHDYIAPLSSTHYAACFPERRDWFSLGRRYLTWTGIDETQRRKIRSFYDACVNRLDGELSRVLDAIDLSSTIVCVTGDHGEGFDYDLARIHHGGRVHNDLINVPLCLHAPRAAAASHHQSLREWELQPMASTDIVPTLLELAGQAAPRGADGRSIVSRDRDTAGAITSEDRRYLYLPNRERVNVNRGGKGTTRMARGRNRVLQRSLVRRHNVKAFIQGHYKLIVTSVSPPPGVSAGFARVSHAIMPAGSTLLRDGSSWLALELFELESDPGELHNLLVGRSSPDAMEFLADRLPGLGHMSVLADRAEKRLADVVARAKMSEEALPRRGQVMT
jgi:arylsulfatase